MLGVLSSRLLVKRCRQEIEKAIQELTVIKDYNVSFYKFWLSTTVLAFTLDP